MTHRKHMTFRAMLEAMQLFARDNPNHEALDEEVIVRIQTNEDNGDDLHVGGLRSLVVDAGCTDTCALVLDADQESDLDADSRPNDAPALNEDQESDEAAIGGTSKEAVPTSPDIFLEIIVRGKADTDKIALAHLIRRTLAVVGFSVKLIDSENNHNSDEIQTLRLATTVQQLTKAPHLIHIRTES